MRCSKCNGQSVFCIEWGEDRNDRIWERWFCPNCGYSYTTNRKVTKKSKSVTTELPDELVINGIKYRRI